MGLRRTSLWCLALLCCVAGSAYWAAGCDNNLKSTFVPAGRFPAAYAQALCTSLQHCCSENAVSYDYNACTAGWEASIATLLASPTASGNYSPQFATQCVALVSAAAAASCQAVPGSLSAARDTCQLIFAGQTPLGGACTASSQCAPVDGGVVQCAAVPGDAGMGGQLPLSSPPSDAATFGTGADIPVCVLLTMPDAGGMPCALPGVDGGPKTDVCLASGLYCDPSSLTCVPFAQMGGTCDESSITSCAAGAYCLAGTCTPTLPPGSPCTDPAECDFTSVCDVAGSKTCILRLLPGAPCTADFQCSVGVCDATTRLCLTNAIATTAACNGVTQ
jgi:hypothetical protein